MARRALGPAGLMLAAWCCFGPAEMMVGCSAPEPIRISKGTGGRSDAGTSTGGMLFGSGGTGTGGFLPPGTGGTTFGSGGSPGSGGLSASGGALGTGGVVSGTGGRATGGVTAAGGAAATGGRASGGAPASGGATGTGGGNTGGGTGMGGRAATGGAGTGGATVGTGGRGGTNGANCITAIQAANYSAGTEKCANCMENNQSRADKCRLVVDCLGTSWPCTGNCMTACLNSASADSVVATCVNKLTAAAMCN